MYRANILLKGPHLGCAECFRIMNLVHVLLVGNLQKLSCILSSCHKSTQMQMFKRFKWFYVCPEYMHVYRHM